jgi:hypothetical protein
VRRSWLRLFLAGVVIVGIIAGFLVSSGLGERLLHQEIETQLGRLLSGRVEIAEVELRLIDGLRVEARGLEAYPSPDPTGQPALRANRVLAWVDLLALLIGRLELSTLILDGPHLRIEQRADGSFVQLPLPPIHSGTDTETTISSGERIVRQLESLPPAASAFADRFRVADRVEILDGTVNWLDHAHLSEDGTPRELRLELVSGTAERNWLSKSIAVDARAVFVDGEHAPFPVEFEMRSDESPHFEWTASFSQVPLKIAEAPLSFIERIKGLTGTLDARIHFSTSDTPGNPTMTIAVIVEDGMVSTREPESIIALGRIALRTELSLDDKTLRISEGHLNDRRLGFDFKGTIERPIRPGSRTRVESRMIGARVRGIRELADRLDEQSELALTISVFTERIESGHIRYIQAAGTAELQHWQNLATGRTRDLPDELLLGGAVEHVIVGTGADERMEILEGEIEWAEDHISLRNMNAVYNGSRLPELSAVIEGVSHLIHASDSARTITEDPPAIPGVGPLMQIFKPLDPDSPHPIKVAALAIDRLEHPLLRWPIHDMRVLIEPLVQGLRVYIREGVWGGAGVEGNFTLLSNSNLGSIHAHLVLSTPPTPPSDSIDSTSEEVLSRSIGNPAHPDEWASGRFELELRPRPRVPFERAVGFFRLDGTNLVGNEVEIELVPRGQAALRADIDLQNPESIGLDLSFAITEATFEGMGEFVLLPPDLVTGDVGATGSLAGLVRPNTSFIAELDGRVRLEAEKGQIETKVPLMFRIGKATEGYNPFAHADELEYESLTGTIEIEHGRLKVEDFEIEGPLRVFANAQLDTNRSPGHIRAVVGVFLFRVTGEILDNLPLVRSFLPGSERGLIGAYFEVEGPLDEPEVEALPLKTLMSSVPDAIKAPFKILRLLFGRGKNDS